MQVIIKILCEVIKFILVIGITIIKGVVFGVAAIGEIFKKAVNRDE